MSEFKCMTCGAQMLTNSFVCQKCEYSIDRVKTKHGLHLVATQNDKERKSKKTYWDWADTNCIKDEDGYINENPYANPDVLHDVRPKTHLGSKCVLCGARVIIHSDGIDPHVHPTCWSTFKGQMMKVTA